ncbi:hypothetical protein HYPSUDRAFT_645955 [Hypholoma sublateritium FD-334 SS-4]|uniref:Peptidase C14 caspase domain-containing protein n=1 Tax=Hypholoma sublateritium (strain FD-334 SS-4) TaxID=945553 RepID=A0A0D2MGD5_HYPSF|nr:hypothetical protein HYPSUDRAFT_645955 [Hypholoma sublateritium FD-334 SS-4]
MGLRQKIQCLWTFATTTISAIISSALNWGRGSSQNIAHTNTGEASLFALLIGINTVDSTIFQRLRGAVSDAERFKFYLQNTLKVDESRIKLLLDKEATRCNIIEAFQNLAKNPDIKRDDSILIFYAGHGWRALPPLRMASLPGCPERVELLIPSDFDQDSQDFQHMGIPDYTLAALLDKVSKSKGNRITLVFDCCHSASIVRGKSTLTASDDPNSREITRAGPELTDWHVPDDLDEEIWGGKRALSTIPTALKDTGSSSYVLFSACKSDEFAKERWGQGYFTNALLKLLNNLGPNKILCSQIIERLEKEIQGQSPQCEGLYSESRPFFQGYTSPYTKNFFNLTAAQDTPLTLNGGEFHGFCEGDQLLVYESGSKGHQEKPIATVMITKVHSDTSDLELVSGSTLYLKYHPNAAAVLSKTAKLMQHLKVHINEGESALILRVDALGLCTVLTDASSGPHISISLAAKQLRFQVVDQDLLKKNVFLKPRLVDDTDENLARILKGLSHYYRHLKRTSNFYDHLFDNISISFFQVRDTGLGHPRIVKVNDAQNLCQNNVIDINVTSNPQAPAIYGFEVTNNTEHDEVVFPVLLYFDNTEFTITQSYSHVVPVEKAESSWPSKGQSMTIGYGVGVGSSVHPFGFCVGEDYDMEAGFFKLFLFDKPVDLQNLVQQESVFTSSRRGVVQTALPNTHRWGSITITVIQRRSR